MIHDLCMSTLPPPLTAKMEGRDVKYKYMKKKKNVYKLVTNMTKNNRKTWRTGNGDNWW